MRFSEIPADLRQGPFTTQQAKAAGITKAALQSSQWRQVFRGVWVHASLPDDRVTRFAAARLVIPPGGVLCGLTAAWIYGADVRRLDDLDVHVGFARGKRIRSRLGLIVSQETLSADDIVSIDGVSSPPPYEQRLTASGCSAAPSAWWSLMP